MVWVCSELHPTWPSTLPGKGLPQLLWSLFQCLITLIVKNFFLISNLNLPPFILKPLPLVLSLYALVLLQVPLQLSCRPLRILKGCCKVSPEPSLLQAEQPQLSRPLLIGESIKILTLSLRSLMKYHSGVWNV